MTFVLTGDDLDRLSYNEYLSFTTAGCTKQDVMQLMTTLDRRFMAGLAYYMGAREPVSYTHLSLPGCWRI